MPLIFIDLLVTASPFGQRGISDDNSPELQIIPHFFIHCLDAKRKKQYCQMDSRLNMS